MERIICAAMHIDNGKPNQFEEPLNIKTGIVIYGPRHHNCFDTVSLFWKDEDYKNFKIIQGYWTSETRFVDRHEGAIIAFNAGQTKTNVKTLYSEHLY